MLDIVYLILLIQKDVGFDKILTFERIDSSTT